MKKLKSIPLIIFFIIASLVLVFSAVQESPYSHQPLLKESYVRINNTLINVEIVSSKPEQARGLSYRDSLDENRGMLFVFNNYETRKFWMKEMRFPIDIIWIKDNKIVGIAKNVPIPSNEEIPIFSSPTPINYVLEVNASFTQDNGIRVGDIVEFNL